MASSDQIASLYGSVGFRIDHQSVKSIFTALDKIKTAVRQIEKQFAGVGISKKFADNFKNVSREAIKVSTSLDEVNKKARSGVAPINDYARAIGGLAMQMGALRANLAGGVRLPKAPGSSGGGSGSYNAPSSSMGFLSGLIGGPGAFARGVVPGLGAGWLARQSILDYRSMLGTEYAMQSITGSEAGGAAEMAYLKQFSNKYGFDVKSSGQQYKGILAASKGTKLEGAAARNIFEGISLQGAALGLDSEKMKRASTAIQQMIGKGKIMAEELKGQLAEALPDAVQVFAKAANDGMGVPVAQLFKMMESGELLAEDILPKVAEIYKKMAMDGGGLKAYTESSLAAQNRFFNKLHEVLVLIAKSGGDKVLAAIFNSMTGILSVVEDIVSLLSKTPLSVWAATATAVIGTQLLPVLKLVAVQMRYIFAPVMVQGFFRMAVAGAALLAKRMVFAFLPLTLLFDTLEAAATGKTGIIGHLSKISGLHGLALGAFEKVLGVPGLKDETPHRGNPGWRENREYNEKLRGALGVPRADAKPATKKDYKGRATVGSINISVSGDNPDAIAKAVRKEVVSLMYEASAMTA